MRNTASLQMISEPEATATHALEGILSSQIKNGDTFVLCDAGGGTVDLVTYKVTKREPRLTLAETCPGTGSCCGSSLLNRRFRQFLRDKLSGEVGFDDIVLNEAINCFEQDVKRNFEGGEDEEFKVPVLGVNGEHLEIVRNRLRVTGIDLLQIFEPVISEVTRLVMQQVRASQTHRVAAVILVGGFGQNVYLRRAITEELRNANPRARLIQSQNPWSAVVRGALTKGLGSLALNSATIEISERSAKQHYGIELCVEWNEEIHDRKRRFLDPYSGKYLVKIFDCYAAKGSKIMEIKPHRQSVHKNLLISEGKEVELDDTEIVIKVCSDPDNVGVPKYCDERNCPRYPNATVLTHLPEDTRDHVKLTADLSLLPASSFPVKIGANRKKYYFLEYEVLITFSSANITYELIYDGENYGSISKEYV